MSKIVLASGNAGKVREINALLQSHGIEVVSQNEFNVPEVLEDGLTFVENAIKKARNACKHTGLPAIADDSGIEVDAMHKAPGIYSARYAGEDANDVKNNSKLLEALSDVPEAERTARYQCVMVYMQSEDDPTPIITQGSLEGRILTSPLGDGGFGYDPLFWLEDKNCSAAQLSLQEKNRISHRGQGLQSLVKKLSDH
jgi:XTP/dITP diphosphohydrolase